MREREWARSIRKRRRCESFSVGRRLVDYPFLLRSLTKYRYAQDARGLEDPFFPPFLLFTSSLFLLSPFLLFSFLSRAYSTLLFFVSLTSLSLLEISISVHSLACPAPCAMPYPTARLIQENVRRFVLLHCGNFVRFRKNAITDRKFKVIFLFLRASLIWN